MSSLCGIWGKPYLDLSPFLDTRRFPELDDEIVYGLANVDTGYTGGSLTWMNVVAP
jgi:Rieske 2Fe-2S family protein